MLNQSEEPARSSTAPRPELNPLLNPLLAENMGRWADVYFSTPPEKRDEAVRALLEELREKNATAPPPEPHNPGNVPVSSDSIACSQCGQENPTQFRFCGNCGSELKLENTVPPAPEAEEHAANDWQHWENPEYSEDASAEPANPTGRFYASPSYHGLSILQGASESYSDEPDFLYEETPSHRFRYVMALFLAIAIGGLGYKAWKATQGTEKAYTPPPPPVSAPDSNAATNGGEGAATPDKTDAEAPTKSAASSKTDSSEEKKTGNAESAPAKAQKASDAGEVKQEEDRKEEAAKNSDAATLETRRNKASAAARAEPRTSAANGSEELSMAEQYLNGANGRRSGAQAAPWLWKSVGKHNAQASLMLADLYLKGDGVSKNCDQARILLDSAARKGVSGAGERLRHLGAFGCQ